MNSIRPRRSTALGKVCLFCLFALTLGPAAVGPVAVGQGDDPVKATLAVASGDSSAQSDLNVEPPSVSDAKAQPPAEEIEQPWDFSPYRVLVWVVSDDSRYGARAVEPELREFLDRDFSSIWRLTIDDAPLAVRAAATRDMDAMDYDTITASDPILAVKRDHPDAVRIRTAENVGEFVQSVLATAGAIEEVSRLGAAADNPTVDGVADRMSLVDGDALTVRDLWAQKNTEAVLISRGMARTLDNPEAKMISPNVADLVSNSIENYDKIFIVRVQSDSIPGQVSVVELDTLMRFFGPVARVAATADRSIGESIGRGLIKAFAPVVRIDDAGQKSASGLLRASGLIVDAESPGLIQVGDVLQPMTRKNDRNGDPFLVGPMDWAYLLVTKYEDRIAEMDFYAGRAGGLQGRKNSRTFRTALKARPYDETTMLRLHAQGDPDFPLIGYEIYEKELMSKSMTFIGRTDWNGRLAVQKTDDPLRLLYVKNGGAVLARLPMVPGLDPKAVADLQGDDLRLQAEAYIRGVQNSIIDLVAVRELFKARIRMRLNNGEMDKAEELMEALRAQPSNEKLNTDMGTKQSEYIRRLGTRNANQKRKIDEMFTSTRELLTKHISPKLIRELESDLIAARNNGGKLPATPAEDDEP